MALPAFELIRDENDDVELLTIRGRRHVEMVWLAMAFVVDQLDGTERQDLADAAEDLIQFLRPASTYDDI